MEEKFEIRKTWRTNNFHEQKRVPPADDSGPMPAEWYPATRFFDQVSFIGDDFVGCYCIETTEGLVLIDCLYGFDGYYEHLVKSLKELDLDPKNIKHVFCTHGHYDHWGNADKLRKAYGCKIYMSKVDHERFSHDYHHVIDFDVDQYIEDGDVYTFGDTTIRCVSTPGHTPGTMSFIFNVTDEGRPHLACIWGGTGVPREAEDKKIYLESTYRFTKICDELGVDVEVSNHPILDNGYERFDLCRHISQGVPNPYVIGKDALHRFTVMLSDFCKSKM